MTDQGETRDAEPIVEAESLEEMAQAEELAKLPEREEVAEAESIPEAEPVDGQDKSIPKARSVAQTQTSQAAAAKGLEPMPEKNLKEALLKNQRPLAMLFLFFILAQLVGMGAATQFDEAGVRAIEEDKQDNTAYSIYYFLFILAFTGVILFIARKGLDRVIKYIFLGAVGMTLVYVCYPFIWWATDNSLASTLFSMAIALGLTYGLVRHPEWYVVDTTGVLMAGGVAAIFGISFGIGPALVLMVAMAVYDAWAVYRTKHMVALADAVMDQKVPILLVAPKTKEYSFLDQGSLKDEIDSGKDREAMFMGLGDLVIPGMLIVAARFHLGWGVGFFALFGALVGFFVLMTYVLKGKPQAGLPLLNGGTIAGYILGVLILGTEWGISWEFTL